MPPQFTTPAEVMARLHLPADHPDAAWIATCTDAANADVAGWLDRTDDPADPDAGWPPLTAPYPPEVVFAATGVAMRRYTFRHTETAQADGWTDPVPTLPADPLAGYTAGIARYRRPAAWSPA